MTLVGQASKYFFPLLCLLREYKFQSVWVKFGLRAEHVLSFFQINEWHCYTLCGALRKDLFHFQIKVSKSAFTLKLFFLHIYPFFVCLLVYSAWCEIHHSNMVLLMCESKRDQKQRRLITAGRAGRFDYYAKLLLKAPYGRWSRHLRHNQAQGSSHPLQSVIAWSVLESPFVLCMCIQQ